ncbi:MAG: SDR family NAD(P)-dependent oxidoreductase [Candidatus Natronoplasma sp.]
MSKIEDFYEGKTVLVTGGVGSIGSEIVKNLLNLAPKVVRILDINESKLFEFEEELNSRKVRTLIGDVRDKERLRKAIEDVDIVFHAAALKHVPLCEYNPFEGVKTNVNGTQNLIDVALEEEVEKFITISTDKVVNPINVMGATKLLAERLTTSANLHKGERRTALSVVRFGNVLNSRGSILPTIKKQIQKGGPVKLTHPDMTRFVMSIDEASKLVIKAAERADGGDVFILKMPALNIIDLIEVTIQELGPKYGYSPDEIEIEEIGIRAGEKLYEELMTSEEIDHAEEIEDMFVFYNHGSLKKEDTGDVHLSTRSDKASLLNKEEIRSMLKEIDYF